MQRVTLKRDLGVERRTERVEEASFTMLLVKNLFVRRKGNCAIFALRRCGIPMLRIEIL